VSCPVSAVWRLRLADHPRRARWDADIAKFLMLRWSATRA
jgi:hypothetical protein